MKRPRKARVITLRQLLVVGLAMALLIGAGAVALIIATPWGGTGGEAAAPIASEPTPEQQQPAAQVLPSGETAVSGGMSVGYSVRPDPTQPGLTEISLTVADAATGQPARLAAPPAAWVDYQSALQQPPPSGALSCQDQVRAYVGGGLDSQAEIDLNTYFVLSLNGDSTISVIDPLHGVTGISQLYAMITLASPGEDWALSQDRRRLFVSMPKAGQVAVIDTDTFSVRQNIDVGLNPTQVAIQPDGRYLWVSNDSTNVTAGGVTLIDVDTLAVKAQIPTGRGRHPIVFSGQIIDTHEHPDEATPAPDAPLISYGFVGNSESGTLSVIDLDRLERHPDIALGMSPDSLSYAGATNTLYAAAASDGTIIAVDAANLRVGAQLSAASGVRDLGFAPDGRWGFALSQASDEVAIIDATTGQIAHRVTVSGGPDKVSFTSAYAYVHAAGRPEIALFDLSKLADADAPAPVSVIGGQLAPSQASAAPVLADAITPVHAHGGHVLIINPADRSIYQYMEGMNAPMGSFQAYSQVPRAVGVIDRSLRLTIPGTYTATVKIPRSGQYRLALLLDTPRVVQCFTFATAPDAPGGPQISLQVLSHERAAPVGAPLALHFALAGQSPLAAMRDVTVLVVMASGQRSDRFLATPLDDGSYRAELVLPAPGSYTAYVVIPSQGIAIGALPSVPLTAR